MAERLAAEVDGIIVWDPEPDAPTPSPWRTYLACLRSIPEGATHALVLQDDVEPCEQNFLPAVRLALAARPTALVSFYVSDVPYEAALAVRRAIADESPWARIDRARWVPAVALAWPVARAHDLLAWEPSADFTPLQRADDANLGRFVEENAVETWATVPSLVEHPDRVESLVGQRNRSGGDPSRVALCFAGPDCDPLTIEWASEDARSASSLG